MWWLNYLDMKSVIFAASTGGNDIWEDCQSKHPEEKKWDSNISSKDATSVWVRLGQGATISSGGNLVVVLARTAKQEESANAISVDGMQLRERHTT